MVKGFNTYIEESILYGSSSVEGTPDTLSRRPDVRTRSNIINTGRSGPGRTSNTPSQWGSTQMSFGANPKSKKNRAKMPNIVKSYQSFTKEKQKVSEQASLATQTGSSPEEQALSTAILNIEKQIQQLNATKIAKVEELNKMRQTKAADLAKSQQQPVPPNQPV